MRASLRFTSCCFMCPLSLLLEIPLETYRTQIQLIVLTTVVASVAMEVHTVQ